MLTIVVKISVQDIILLQKDNKIFVTDRKCNATQRIYSGEDKRARQSSSAPNDVNKSLTCFLFLWREKRGK